VPLKGRTALNRLHRGALHVDIATLRKLLHADPVCSQTAKKPSLVARNGVRIRPLNALRRHIFAEVVDFIVIWLFGLGWLESANNPLLWGVGEFARDRQPIANGRFSPADDCLATNVG